MAKSFKTAFNSVYEKGLAKYGFQKVKGSQPYYVRCIGDEIIHVITFRDYSNPCFDNKFAILFGTATVYRKTIAIGEPGKDSQSWLSPLSIICYKENYYPIFDHKAYEEMIPFRFKYDRMDDDIMSDEIKEAIKEAIGWDENSMMDAINKSFELTVKYAIPILDKITTLEDCVKHFYKYKPALICLHEDCDAYIQGRWTDPYNEGLLLTVIYGNDRFEEYENIELKALEECNEEELYDINAGMSGLTMEQHENYKKERMANHKAKLEIYKELMKPEWQAKIHKELELRKKTNLELLRKYGLEI